MRITLVRHGETTGQSSARYYGATDVPLSNVGRAQMRSVAAALAGERFAAVFSSGLCRSREAAEMIASDGVQVIAIAEFNEVCFGRWEGWTREEIIARDAEHYRLWQQSDESFCYPEGESRSAFRERVVAGMAHVLPMQSGGNILLVVHKGVIAVILAELLRLAPTDRKALGIELGSIHEIAREGDGWRALYLNRMPPFEEGGQGGICSHPLGGSEEKSLIPFLRRRAHERGGS